MPFEQTPDRGKATRDDTTNVEGMKLLPRSFRTEGTAMDQAIEERFTRIEEWLAKAHCTGIEAGATLVAVVRVICEAWSLRAPRLADGFESALDGAKDKPVATAPLEGRLEASRR